MTTTTETPAAPVRRLLYSADQVCEVIGIGRTKWYSLVATGQAPQPIRIGRRTLWPVDAIEGFVRDRALAGA